MVRDLGEFFTYNYDLIETPIPDRPGFFATRVDYPPHGSAGLGVFLLTYEAPDPTPHMREPYRTFTFHTLVEVSGAAG